MNSISQEQFIRGFKVMNNGEIDFFLGAGASIQSGIPTGANLVWHFKRELYCTENNISTEQYKDLKLDSTQQLLQSYFDKQGGHPELYAPDEYSHYFEKCFATSISRKRFIESIVTDKNPSLGYLCLANLIVSLKLKNVWTTNFDPLVETALHIFAPSFSYVVCSSAIQDSIKMLNPTYPAICKLHGDFRYDKLQNTKEELQEIETQLHQYAYTQLCGKGIMVIGYSGSDESIMSFFEKHIEEPEFLSKGLYWANRKGGQISPRVKLLVEQAIKVDKNAAIVDIDNFDDFMYSTYKSICRPNQIIDEKWKEHPDTKKPLIFQGQSSDCFIKLNAYVTTNFPLCHVFETDITNWSDLRTCIGDDKIIAALFSGHIYCFASTDHINLIFEKHIKSTITLTPVENRIIYRNDSIYIGMLYQLINRYMISKGMVEYRKNKYLNPKTKANNNGLFSFDALEISLSCISGKIYMNLLPTVHFAKRDGKQLDKASYQDCVNKAISTIYNKQYNEKLKQWESILYSSGKMIFEYEGFQLEFQTPALSCGGRNRQDNWPELSAWIYPETPMRFSEKDFSKSNINQLKGLINFGPIDCSYTSDKVVRNPVKLAILAPNEYLPNVLAHLNGLNERNSPKGKDQFLQNYEGFLLVYRRPLLIPTVGSDLCIGYSEKTALTMSPDNFLAFLKRGMDHFATKSTDFHVLVIYIPKSFSVFRESKSISADFNLHDAIKLYATDRGIRVQFIEERSINTYDPCKVRWGLSTSLYAKSSGVLWHPQAIHDGTAYVGISYAQSEEKGICIGCSQLFDSTGTGIRMILRKIDNPHFYGKKCG